MSGKIVGCSGTKQRSPAKTIDIFEVKNYCPNAKSVDNTLLLRSAPQNMLREEQRKQ
jgi:hypothetical protein